jgi:hypothetical protein
MPAGAGDGTRAGVEFQAQNAARTKGALRKMQRANIEIVSRSSWKREARQQHLRQRSLWIAPGTAGNAAIGSIVAHSAASHNGVDSVRQMDGDAPGFVSVAERPLPATILG